MNFSKNPQGLKISSMQGWIKLHRQMIKWEWYDHIPTKVLFLHLLLKANHKDNTWRGIEVKRGQVITGRKNLSKETGLSERQVRTAMKNLRATGEIKQKASSHFTSITICNYDSYQAGEEKSDQQATSKRPASDQQATTNKNEENEENEENFLGGSVKTKFMGSPLADLQSFREAIGKDGYEIYDLGHYHEKLKNWAEAKGATSKDWEATAKNFILNDDQKHKHIRNKGAEFEKIEEVKRWRPPEYVDKAVARGYKIDKIYRAVIDNNSQITKDGEVLDW